MYQLLNPNHMREMAAAELVAVSGGNATNTLQTGLALPANLVMPEPPNAPPPQK
jgi:hypothetical protein